MQNQYIVILIEVKIPYKTILVFGGGFDYSLVNFNWALMKQKFRFKVYPNVKTNPKRITLVTFRKFQVKLYGKSNENCANKTSFNLYFMLRGFNLNFMLRASKLLFDIRINPNFDNLKQTWPNFLPRDILPKLLVCVLHLLELVIKSKFGKCFSSTKQAFMSLIENLSNQV